MENILIKNIDSIHTTDMGLERIRRNLELGDIDVVEWCKEKILAVNAFIEKQGKSYEC